MNYKKALFSLAAVALLTCSMNVQARRFFFTFIIHRTGELAGAGDNCVSEKSKIGDVLTSPAGNTAKVVSLFGTSYLCQDVAYPIRAELEFNYSFQSSAGIELTDSFKAKDLTPIQRFNGTLLHAIDDERHIGVYVFARPVTPGSDPATLAENVSKSIVALIDHAEISNPEELTINGLHAYRFKAKGSNKGLFGRNFTYVVTVMESKKEYVVVNVNCRTDDFDDYEKEMKKMAFNVKGINEEPLDGATPSNEAIVKTETSTAPAATLPLGANQEQSPTPGT
jgi:hypothetical protein